MKQLKIRFESMIFLIIGFGLLALYLSPNRIIYLKILNAARLWEKYSNAIYQLLIIYCILSFSLSVIGIIFSVSNKSLIMEISRWFSQLIDIIKNSLQEFRKEYAQSGSTRYILPIIIMIGIFIRIPFLNQPMFYDEAVSFLEFINQGLPRLFLYPLPNNHVLHSIFVKISISLLGVSPLSIRMPAYIAGIGIIPVIYFLCRSLKLSGVFAAVTLAISPYLVFYSTNSRGYMLLCLLSIFLVKIGETLIKEGLSPSLVFVFSLVSSFGMLTIPTMLFPIIGTSFWIITSQILKGHPAKTIFLNFIIPASYMTGFFTVILYSPVILRTNGFEDIISNRFVIPVEWNEFLSGTIPHIQTTFRVFNRDIPTLFLIFFTILLVLGFIDRIRKNDYIVYLLIPLSFIGSLILVFLKQRIPYPRIWIFFIPILAITADAGYSYLIRSCSKQLKRILSSLLLIGATLYSITIVSTNSNINYAGSAEVAALYLNTISDEKDRVYANCCVNYPLYFYLDYHDIPIRYYDVKNQEPNNIYYLVQKGRYEINDMTQENTRLIFSYKDHLIYQADN